MKDACTPVQLIEAIGVAERVLIDAAVAECAAYDRHAFVSNSALQTARRVREALLECRQAKEKRIVAVEWLLELRAKL